MQAKLAILFFVVSLAKNVYLASVACPELSDDKICPGRDGFQYSDGCNQITCSSDGTGITTLMFCEGPKDDEQKQYCQGLLAEIQNKGETVEKPVTCSALTHDKVCTGPDRAGLEYSDGCNTITCGENGMDMTTLMFCEESDMDTGYCRKMQNKLDKALRKSDEPSRTFTCPDLDAEKVCKWHMAGFSYNDGCNSITCGYGGSVRESTFMFCEVASGETGAEYCQERRKEVKEKKARSKLHRECLQASEICTSESSEEQFYDGCNYCYCMGNGQAACTKRACEAFFGTDKEFEKECKQRGSGIVN